VARHSQPPAILNASDSSSGGSAKKSGSEKFSWPGAGRRTPVEFESILLFDCEDRHQPGRPFAIGDSPERHSFQPGFQLFSLDLAMRRIALPALDKFKPIDRFKWQCRRVKRLRHVRRATFAGQNPVTGED
jgi:hypothetical protein